MLHRLRCSAARRYRNGRRENYILSVSSRSRWYARQSEATLGGTRTRAPQTRRLEPFPSAGHECPVKPSLSAVLRAPRCAKTETRRPGYINERSITVLHAFLHVALVVEAVRHLDPRRHLLALRELLRNVACERAKERARLHARAKLASRDRIEAALRAVDRDDLDILARLFACRLDRGDRAERHFVVVRVDGRDIR